MSKSSSEIGSELNGTEREVQVQIQHLLNLKLKFHTRGKLLNVFELVQTSEPVRKIFPTGICKKSPNWFKICLLSLCRQQFYLLLKRCT
jgi:hypothetical protein